MPRTIKKRENDPVKQFSVYTENKLGRLNDLARLLCSNNVHIMALTTLDTTESAIIRIIVDDPQKTRKLLRKGSFPYTEADVLAIEMNTEADLKNVLAALLEAEINIHYAYGFFTRPGEKLAVALSLEDPEFAIHALYERNFRLLDQGDISR